MRGRPRRGGGFTLIELMIVIAIIAIIAAIAIPNLIEARKASNEASAIQTLRSIHAAQTLFRDRDYDHDGQADFATMMLDLRGLLPDRVCDDPGAPFTTAGGKHSGYYLGMIQDGGGNAHGWGAAAAAVSFGKSGDRTFFIDDTGVIRYSTSAFSETAIAVYRAWPAIGQ